MHFTSRRDHDVEVNDRLGSQARDGGSSNMLNCSGNIAHERQDPISKATKLIEPFWIVVHNLNDAARGHGVRALFHNRPPKTL
jgi:hypothetical protein